MMKSKATVKLGNLRYDDEMRRRRRPEVRFAQMRVLRMSVCDFVVHGSLTTKFVGESRSGENVSKTCVLEALFRGFQLIF